MTEENKVVEGQEPEKTEPQEGTPGQEPSAAGQEPEAKKETSSDPTAQELSEARREAAKYRTELREAQAKLKEREDAELSEADKLRKQAQEAEERAAKAEERARTVEFESKVQRQAVKDGAIDPADVVRFLDRDEITDDEGKVTSEAVEKAVAELKKAKPHLFGQPSGSTTSAANGAAGKGVNYSAEDLRKLAKTDPEKFNELWEKGIPQKVLEGS